MANLNLRGCATTELVKYYPTRFNEGAYAYVLASAQKGKLEKVYLKQIVMNFFPQVIKYIDTLNELWFEKELCTQQEAIAAATDYYTTLQENTEEATEECMNGTTSSYYTVG